MSLLGSIDAVRLVSAAPEQLAARYAAAFGFRTVAMLPRAPAASHGIEGPPGATASGVVLQLGKQRVELVSIDPPGRPYPPAAGSADTIFQHIAIVVSDMSSALERLVSAGDFAPISTDGPQMLPASSGGVVAYKFRDPEGHPLEFLAFPELNTPAAWADRSGGPCLGFDHSAIAVCDTKASLAFYQRLGLERVGGSLNVGVEQARLDAVRDAVVEVTALATAASPPHLELLCYRGGMSRTATAGNDVAATQILFAVADVAAVREVARLAGDHVLPPGILETDGRAGVLLADPDGHRLLVRTPLPG